MRADGCSISPAAPAPSMNTFLLSADTELKTIQPSGCNASFIFISISGRCPPCPPMKTASGRGEYRSPFAGNRL